MPAEVDRRAIREGMERARQDFHRLLADASDTDLARPSEGTRWNNRQLLFHMLFGYLLVRALLVLHKALSALPDPASRVFAGVLNSARGPFHVVNYLGSCAGARVLSPARMDRMLDTVIVGLARGLDTEPEPALRRRMCYPTTWDPFFTPSMTLADLYRYPTRHFRHHLRQLTLGSGGPARRAGTGLTPSEAKRFYDRFGRKQDLQSFYEDRAVRDLVTAGSFGTARAVFELGCGTGRLAADLLAHHLPGQATYLGADISGTMVALSQARLSRFGDRARVLRADGTADLPAVSGGFDRFVAVYVLDLLGHEEATVAIAQARRLLRPGGLLCLASLAPGQGPVTGAVSRAWTGVWSRAPGLVGGCRPICLEPLLPQWRVTHRAMVTAWGLTSEVVVAAR